MKSFIIQTLLLIFCCIFMTAGLMAQTGIRGIVRDKKSGVTIVGANVVIKGSSRGTSTGIDGSFSISGLAAGEHTLVVSFISYKPIEISIMKNLLLFAILTTLVFRGANAQSITDPFFDHCNFTGAVDSADWTAGWNEGLKLEGSETEANCSNKLLKIA